MPESPKPKSPISHLIRHLPRKIYLFLARFMANLAVERSSLMSKLRSLRWVCVVVGFGNLGVALVGVYMLSSMSSTCSFGEKLTFITIIVIASVRIVSMVGVALAQMETASSVANCLSEGYVAVDASVRHERRVRYRRWLWWTRFGMVITISQIVGALYLSVVIFNVISSGPNSRRCFLAQERGMSSKWGLVIFFPVIIWIVAISQCFTGSDVLRWRSFYSTHDNAWKAHYHEVFDHGIREFLCCLGRSKYMSVLGEDEVYSVARLLGDLVAYRASGTGHLEILAGLSLLQRHRQMPNHCNEPMEAPENVLQEAVALHPFAEAAYTGPLLDFGRNPIWFPCSWLHRQGILTPWMRRRRPMLEGDNWWRGHAAAFLKYINMPPEVLRRGRVSQLRREAAYFVVVLHHTKTVVIAVRGTETPEDLITDGLCRECLLSADDLDGVLNDALPPEVKQQVLISFPHYGHSGIVESARELYSQLQGKNSNEDSSSSESGGFLPSLLGDGCECQGYKICIVGHSLGGAVGTMLGIRLFRQYPNLHVCSYGTLPCVDKVVADACSGFVTSIIYSDEFSARLSVNSIIRLRAAAITALSENPPADSAIMFNIVRRILQSTRAQGKGANDSTSSSPHPPSITVHGNGNQRAQRTQRTHFKFTIKGGIFLCSHALTCLLYMPSGSPCKSVKTDLHILESHSQIDLGACEFNAGQGDTSLHREETHLIVGDSSKALEESSSEEILDQMDAISGCDGLNHFEDHRPDQTHSSVQLNLEETVEMFLPGLVVHIVPKERRSMSLLSWKIRWRDDHRALLADREAFRDILVTPYMFLDHLPWRCHYAMQRALVIKRTKNQTDENISKGEVV
ncbi:lipase class 3 family protein isoform X2 [Wolffia australiana]